MRVTLNVEPQKDVMANIPVERRITAKYQDLDEYSIAYIGPYSYCWNLSIDNAIEFTPPNVGLIHNVQIGNSNSIANGLECFLSKNHDIKCVSLGGIDTIFDWSGIKRKEQFETTYRQKGSVVIQNDVWIGEKCTIMGGITVHNGAAIARNSHVVSDVPPYAIVGGNPAKVIGYRFNKDIIDKLQIIQWWYWSREKLIENFDLFNEDVEGFCDRFYEDALKEFNKLLERRNVTDDAYFAFVDYYENYCAYPHIVESFLDEYIADRNKRLVLYIQTDCDVEKINDSILNNLLNLAEEINNSPDIYCKLDIRMGDKNEAREVFLECSHYIISRTFNTVYFTCLADQFGIEVLSGVDNIIPFKKRDNMIRVK